MKYAVITGSSKGLGASISKKLIEQGVHVVGVSRNNNADLEEHANKLGGYYEHENCDLKNPTDIEAVFTSISERIFTGDTEQVILINNAGVVEPIDRAGNHQVNELSDHVHINLLAPMITTNIFLKKVEQQNHPTIVINVTSGAADRSVFGWSAYSGTKAGLNRFTETVALEQKQKALPTKSILFSPGIMDTQMQTQIRSTSEGAFRDVNTFKQYKDNDQLRSPDEVVTALLKVIDNYDKVKSGKTYHVRDLL